MKKIGILNFQHVNHNYGAVLQAAALEESVKKIGYNVEQIDFIPDEEPPPPPLSFTSRITRLLKGNFVKIILNKLQGNKEEIPEVIGDDFVFEDFRQKWVSRSKESYGNFDDLKKIENTYDAIIVGSDQVWRTQYINRFSLVYFLSFAGSQTKRISYAASFGLDTWQKDDRYPTLETQVKTELAKFDAVSVREDSGVNVCQSEFSVKATHVLDPTLLIGQDFFDSIIDKATTEKTGSVVYYKLDPDEEFKRQVEQIANKLQLPIEDIYHKNIAGKKYFNTVQEWLLKLRESELVVTDSFHCVCFAILFEKQFIYFANKGRGMSRLESLLGLFDLMDRVCFTPQELGELRHIENKIDYSVIRNKLIKLRETSFSFLTSSLKN